MSKAKKVEINYSEKIEGNVCDLSLSELTEVPVNEIAKLKRITILDLSSNKLTSLGKNFTSLTQLSKLDLSKNELKSLPEDFGKLIHLRHLNLYNNKLEHLPLSFGNLRNLRYLDLKENPLTPALVKLVGYCFTTKDCRNAARCTVEFLRQMQEEADKTKQMQRHMHSVTQEKSEVMKAKISEKPSNGALDTEETLTDGNQRSKTKQKKSKQKQKKQNNNNINNNNNNSNKTTMKATSQVPVANKGRSHQKNTELMTSRKSPVQSSTALTSIVTFFILLAFNILIIYMIMFKNPEIANKLVEMIPHQYRNWILTKIEGLRLCVTDWISEFHTPLGKN